MVLEVGDRIHVVTRRHFEDEMQRHFVGEVLAYSATCVRVHGYAFVLDTRLNEYVKRPKARTRIISIADSGNVITVLPEEVSLGALRYVVRDGRLRLTDGVDFHMDVREFGP